MCFGHIDGTVSCVAVGTPFLGLASATVPLFMEARHVCSLIGRRLQSWRENNHQLARSARSRHHIQDGKLRRGGTAYLQDKTPSNATSSSNDAVVSRFILLYLLQGCLHPKKPDSIKQVSWCRDLAGKNYPHDPS